MTTTLRPTEPLQQHADGTRSRHYRVCVNSRPVGELNLGTSPSLGDSVACVLDLRIDEGDRRRGRGTVALLAAEEVARGWDCRRIEARVPAEAGAALHLFDTLGYSPRNSDMEKRLGDTPPALPGGSVPRPMTETEYTAWFVHESHQYARIWIELGLPEADAYAKARRDHELLLPQGQDSADQLLTVLEHDGVRVGTLWVALHPDRAFVCDVKADPAHRGKGHGRTLMLLAEAQTIAAGRRLLGLNVFAGNTPAERLYASLGYRTTARSLHKLL